MEEKPSDNWLYIDKHYLQYISGSVYVFVVNTEWLLLIAAVSV